MRIKFTTFSRAFGVSAVSLPVRLTERAAESRLLEAILSLIQKQVLSRERVFTAYDSSTDFAHPRLSQIQRNQRLIVLSARLWVGEQRV